LDTGSPKLVCNKPIHTDLPYVFSGVCSFGNPGTYTVYFRARDSLQNEFTASKDITISGSNGGGGSCKGPDCPVVNSVAK